MREIWVHNTVARMLDNDENNLVSGRYLTVANMQEVAYSLLPTDTASGAVASFSDGADDVPMLALNVAVEPVQDLHGYENPWPAGGGANILDLEAYIKSRTTDYSVDDDGWITINNLGNAGLYANHWTVGELANRSSIILIDSARTTATNVALRLYNGTSAVANVTATDNNRQFDNIGFNWSGNGSATVKVAIVNAATISAWTPYENICPISGWSAAEVNVNGETITHEFKDGLGNTLTVYGGEDDLIGGKLRVTAAKVVFDGTQNVSFYAFTNQGIGRIEWPTFQNIGVAGVNFLSDTLRIKAAGSSVTSGDTWAIMNNLSSSGAPRMFMLFPINVVASVADFKTYCEVHPITVIYPLASPIEYDLTAEHIHTLYGDNTIFADCGDVKVTYRADIGLYIDKKLAGQRAALTNNINNITVLDTVKATFSKRRAK